MTREEQLAFLQRLLDEGPSDEQIIADLERSIAETTNEKERASLQEEMRGILDTRRLDALRHSSEVDPQSDLAFLFRLLDAEHLACHEHHQAFSKLSSAMAEINNARLSAEARLSILGTALIELDKCWTLAEVRAVIRRALQECDETREQYDDLNRKIAKGLSA
ncbi:MAG TPA: hypothetical protein VJN67_07660 [Stellaceae bacterium]|nr:hypothetical protein [Stellaceae bacterium]